MLSQRFYNKMEVGIDPTEFDGVLLNNVPIKDNEAGCEQKYKAFLLRVISDNVKYIGSKKCKKLVKFLLVDNDYLCRGDRHCMVILKKIPVDHNNKSYYFCQNWPSTIKGDAKIHEEIEVSRRDIHLHKLNVQPEWSNDYKLAMKDPKSNSNSSHVTDESPRVVNHPEKELGIYNHKNCNL